MIIFGDVSFSQKIDIDTMIMGFLRDPNTHRGVLTAITVLDDYHEDLVSNPKCDGHMMDLMAHHPDPHRVAFRIACDTRTFPETLAYLAESSDSSVRIGVATNPNTPDDVIKKLEKDTNPKVRASARSGIGRYVVIS